MNTLLENLFEKYHLSEKDQYEIRQIYELLPLEKQRNLLKNFPLLASRLASIEEELRVEREILIGDALVDVRNILQVIKK